MRVTISKESLDTLKMKRGELSVAANNLMNNGCIEGAEALQNSYQALDLQ